MKDLIDAVIAFLTAAIGTELDVKVVQKGFGSKDLEEIPIERYPFIEVDEGGEEIVSQVAAETQERRFRVVLFMAVITGSASQSLDDILDISNQVKALFEKEANRQLDGHVWGVSINPVAASRIDDGTYQFFRGREVVVEYNLLEDNYGEY